MNFDDYDVGRFRVFFGEFTAKGVMPKLGAFTNALGEMLMISPSIETGGSCREGLSGAPVFARPAGFNGRAEPDRFFHN